MAQKRMFDKSLIETDEFMDMPMATKALYFLLGMEADDEGFVSPKRVMRIYGGNEDDLKILVAKNYVIKFESNVVVITDWRENNYLDKNRIRETRYQAEKRLLTLKNNKYAMLNAGLTGVEPVENRIEENRVDNTISEQSSQVNEIMKIFYSINPTLNWGNKTTRKACQFLINKFGLDETMRMAEAVVSVQGQPYAPVATTPYEMKEKLAKFKIFFESRKSNSPKFVQL